jgi:hypothetical protein
MSRSQQLVQHDVQHVCWQLCFSSLLLTLRQRLGNLITEVRLQEVPDVNK